MEQADYQAEAAAAARALQRWYSRWTGQWRTTGWWNAANALTVLVRYTKLTGDRTHAPVIAWTYWVARLHHRHFLARYFDDNGWWALAWIDAYDLSGNGHYLDAACRIFDNMTTAWDDTCRGGLWWSEDRKYKNAITNELFLTVAARLHQRAGERGPYRDWAMREHEWFLASGMIGPGGLINDGLTAECTNNGKPAYTYNQGVILGGLAALFEITGDAEYLRQGDSIAGAALRGLVSQDGILVEPGEEAMAEAGRRGDASQFKGIFIRNLRDFYRHSSRADYAGFICRNADSVLANSRNDNDQFGVRWTGPFDVADASRQSSALDVLIAAAAVAG